MRVESVLIPATRQVMKRQWLADGLFRFDRWGSPLDPEYVANPQAAIDRMRQDPPVVWRRMYQQWCVLGYEEAREVLGSPHVGTAHQMEVLLDVRPYTKLSPRSRSFLANFMLLTDPPKHSRLRGLVNRAFTPRQVAGLDERMNEIIDGLIGNFADEEIELMNAFAVPFPAYVIAELFGFSADDWDWLSKVSPVTAQVLDPMRSFDPATVDAAVDEFHDRIITLARKRRDEPRDDLMTALALAEADDGDSLTEEELFAVAGFMLLAGHETTASMIGNSILALAEYPDQLAMVRANPSLWPNAVDELLRYDTPVLTDPRTALEDFELAGNRIKKGQNIAVLNMLANRDLRRFPDADELRLDRPNPAPISFGHGIHYCLGANLARAELLAALPKLIDALGDFTVDRNDITWRESMVIRGPAKLPVRFTGAP